MWPGTRVYNATRPYFCKVAFYPNGKEEDGDEEDPEKNAMIAETQP